MANIDTETHGLSVSTLQQVKGVVVSSEGVGEGLLATNVPDRVAESSTGDVAPVPYIQASESSTTSRPTIITAVASGSTSSTGLSAPVPKKFSAVNINKKFLQQNSSPISSSPISANAASLKTGSPSNATVRPISQLAATPSRLVTTKLTATPQNSLTTGPGWSKSSSSSISLAPSPIPVTSTSESNAVSAPQLPHAGTVIQPQRASNAAIGGARKDGLGKAVWGNTISGLPATDTSAQNDFPTAAEVANVTQLARKTKLSDAKEAAESAAADKQARSVEADTFRGIHLDPNAHHWDEMEEDDDNFLDGVIEFGDGRQYKVQTADTPLGSNIDQNLDPNTSVQSIEATADPVSKEERFADDFDRSWPKSKSSPVIPQREPPPHTQPNIPPSPSSPQALHSPHDASKVLFNERSNRLEPYSNNHPPHRAGPGPGPHIINRRGSHAENGLPNDLRGMRDHLPAPQPPNIHLSHNGPGIASHIDGPTRPGPFGPIPSGAATTYNKDRPRERDLRRNALPLHALIGQDLPPPAVSTGARELSRDFSNQPRSRRLSNMGPPPLPLPLPIDQLAKNGRELPPHLSQGPTSPMRRRPSIAEASPLLSAAAPSEAPSSRRSSFVHPNGPTSAPPLVPTVVEAIPEPLPIVDLELVHKTAMQQSAERARLRRQQEEDERAKTMERARQKAAEMDAKQKELAAIKVSPAVVKTKPSDVEVNNFIASAIKEDIEPRIGSLSPSITKPTMTRPPSQRPVGRLPSDGAKPGPPLRVPSQTATLSLATEVDSWRSKSKVAPPSPARSPQFRPLAHTSPVAKKAPPPMLHGVETLAVNADEDLEVVDFLDMGKFVGVADAASIASQEITVTKDPVSRAARPVAADFFEANTFVEDTLLNDNPGLWRRKVPQDVVRDNLAAPGVASVINQEKPDAELLLNGSTTVGLAIAEAVVAPTSSIVDHSTQSISHSGSLLFSAQPQNRPPPRANPAYREATMSALDDTMSRIKGALVGMHITDSSKGSATAATGEPTTQDSIAHRPRVPSSTYNVSPRDSVAKSAKPRRQISDFDQGPPEVFDLTMPEPPRSPKPAWNAFVVRLPKVTYNLGSLSKRQYHLHKVPAATVRWDILSFIPPVEGMNRRDLSLNDVLFRKPNMVKGKSKYMVSIPRRRSLEINQNRPEQAGGPKVSLPTSPLAKKANGLGVFGRSGGADGQSTWRKPTVPPLVKSRSPTDAGLDTISRSPPPDPPILLSTTDERAFARSKSPPKMPSGSAVGFYRDARLDPSASERQLSVSFTVTSELEDLHPSKTNGDTSGSQFSSGDPQSRASSTLSQLKSQPSSPEFVPRLVQSKAGSKSSEDSTDRTPLTPPQQHASAPWAKSPLSYSIKESPARAPDPEHLKAVWSQTSDKARVHSINSLEGIADDLTALPFTLQDVKSEDGETPPPQSSSAASSRMSSHDVTRIFQQVPSSSSTSSSQRPTPILPPSVNGPVARPLSFPYTLPPPNPNTRPQYGTYPSPMMSHSPSTTLVYAHMAPSPGPNRMPLNGQAQMYNPPISPMWMPSPTQPHPSVMRPAPSPYASQMMPFPPPGAQPMYAPPSMQNAPSQQNGTAGHGRGMPMSPALQQVPMYPGSPMQMHSSSSHPQSYMSPIQAGRGQMRPDLPRPNASPMQQHAPSLHHASHYPGYNPVPQTSFVRPSW